MTDSGMYAGLMPLLEDVWEHGEGSVKAVYYFYSGDLSLPDPAHDVDQQTAFVETLWQGLADVYDDVGMISGTEDGIKQGSPTPVWLFPQDADQNLDRKCWENFYHIYRQAPYRRTTHRVYARFDESDYATNAIGGALAVANNKGLPTSSGADDRGIWEGVTSLKVAAPGGANRRDHLVVYLSDEDWVLPVANLLRDAQARGETRLREGVPPGLRIIDQAQPGIGTAAEPPRLNGQNQSFGMVLAREISAAYEGLDEIDFDRFVQEVTNRLIAIGINPRKPYLPPKRRRDRSGRRNPRYRATALEPADPVVGAPVDAPVEYAG